MLKGMYSKVMSIALCAVGMGMGSSCADVDPGQQIEDAELGGVAQAATRQPLTFGTRCQAAYQNGWQTTWDNYGACAGFNNKFDDTDTKKFYFNLHGATSALRDAEGDSSLPEGGPDSVDFFLMSAHGGNNTRTWFQPMWDDGLWWNSPEARLGDDGVGAKVFADYGCFTMENDTLDRMRPMFRGGLRLAAGAYGLVYSGSDGWGADFASRMQGGAGIKSAWLNAVYNADNRNTPIVWATGANRDDCYTRIGATLSNVKGLTPLRDNSAAYYCYFWI